MTGSSRDEAIRPSEDPNADCSASDPLSEYAPLFLLPSLNPIFANGVELRLIGRYFVGTRRLTSSPTNGSSVGFPKEKSGSVRMFDCEHPYNHYPVDI